MLIGGAGTDLLTGGGGQDRFVFEKGGGLDVILDFDAGKGAGDVLDLTAFAKVDAMSDLRITSFLGSAVVSAEGVTITLTRVRVGELAADDFLFAGQSPSVSADLFAF